MFSIRFGMHVKTERVVASTVSARTAVAARGALVDDMCRQYVGERSECLCIDGLEENQIVFLGVYVKTLGCSKISLVNSIQNTHMGVVATRRRGGRRSATRGALVDEV